MARMGDAHFILTLAALAWAAPAAAQSPLPSADLFDARGDSATVLRRRASRWADSQLQVGVSANADLFDRTYRPASRSLAALDLWVTALPRYRVGDHFQLRAAWGFEVELANSDSTTTRHEPVVGDPSIELWFLGTPALGELRFSFGAGVELPVSNHSRALTTILTVTATARASWAANVAAGRFTAVLTGGYGHTFSGYTTPGIRGDFPYERAVGGDLTTVGVPNQLSGRTNVHDALGGHLTVAQAWGRWSPGLSFGLSRAWAYATTGGALSGFADPSHARDTSSFAAWLDASASSWLTFELGYTMSRRLLRDDGTWGNPFYDPSQDWRVYLVANVELDRLGDALSDRGAGLGRILRASAR
jgi:hypothetical protein